MLLICCYENKITDEQTSGENQMLFHNLFLCVFVNMPRELEQKIPVFFAVLITMSDSLFHFQFYMES